MPEDNKSNSIRKIADYLIFGSGIGGVSEGLIRLANSPPENFNLLNNLANKQYLYSIPLILLGGALTAYSLERIIKYSRK